LTVDQAHESGNMLFVACCRWDVNLERVGFDYKRCIPPASSTGT
jgi:hypothetical protein